MARRRSQAGGRVRAQGGSNSASRKRTPNPSAIYAAPGIPKIKVPSPPVHPVKWPTSKKPTTLKHPKHPAHPRHPSHPHYVAHPKHPTHPKG